MMKPQKSSIKLKKQKKNINREKLIYKSGKNTYNFKNFETIRTFSKGIYKGEITFKEADEYQSILLNKIKKQSQKMILKSKKKKLLVKTC